MVYTITFSPALDYTLSLNTLSAGSIQRSVDETIFAGGKGINVSNVLTQLGIPNVALGFTAGFTGAEIERLTHMLGIKTDFVCLTSGNSRINVKIRTADGNETAINAKGCDISAASLSEFYQKIDAISEGDYLVLSGIIPESLSDDIYGHILHRLENKHVRSIVDAEGSLLLNTLKYNPFLIKPNREELCDLFGQKVETAEDVVRLAKALKELGAKNVLVSMGAEGSILLTETNETLVAPVSRYPVINTTASGDLVSPDAQHSLAINTVAAGDSMIAGFIAGWLKYEDYHSALLLGAAAGTATAFCEGVASGDEIYAVWRRLLT